MIVGSMALSIWFALHDVAELMTFYLFLAAQFDHTKRGQSIHLRE